MIANKNLFVKIFLERVTGIGPVFRPWQGRIIPLYDTRVRRQARNVWYFVKIFTFWQLLRVWLLCCSIKLPVES